MTQTYTYTYEVTFNFDAIIAQYQLEKDNLSACMEAIADYIDSIDVDEFDTEIGYIIDNKDEIAVDLYNYIQEKKD